jgi:MerR family copper efflux transcriptional regulator
MRSNLTIGAVARAAGVSAKTIRYYEAIGLLPAPRRGPNDYRYYTADTANRLRFIQRAKLLGLTLDEIRALITASGDGRCDLLTPELRQIVAHKLAECDRRLDELRALRAALASVSERLATRELPASASACRVASAYAPDCPCMPDLTEMALDIPVQSKL